MINVNLTQNSTPNANSTNETTKEIVISTCFVTPSGKQHYSDTLTLDILYDAIFGDREEDDIPEEGE